MWRTGKWLVKSYGHAAHSTNCQCGNVRNYDYDRWNNPMNYRHLGRSGLQVSPIGLGTDNFANPVTEADARAILDRAAAAGINLVDTSNSYGEQRGASEQFIGDWMRQRGNRHRRWRSAWLWCSKMVYPAPCRTR